MFVLWPVRAGVLHPRTIAERFAPGSFRFVKFRAGVPEANACTSGVFKPFVIYSDQISQRMRITRPSGYMGDSDLTLSGAYIPSPNGGTQGPLRCASITKPTASKDGPAFIGRIPPITGESPGEKPATICGGRRPYLSGRAEKTAASGFMNSAWAASSASIRIPTWRTYPNVKLGSEWKKYTIDLRKKDLRHIIGGFCFLFLKTENSGGMTAYLDDIQYGRTEWRQRIRRWPSQTRSSQTARAGGFIDGGSRRRVDSTRRSRFPWLRPKT